MVGLDYADALGWVGSVLLAACAVPEVVNAYKTGKCGITWGMLWVWQAGEVLTWLAVVTKIGSPFLLFNYSVNIVLISYLIWVKRRSGLK